MNNTSIDIKKDFKDLLDKGSNIQIMYCLIGIGIYLDDYEYVINACKRLFSNKNPIILRVIFALGHLARSFGILYKNFYNSIINKALVYSDQVTVDAAQN